jgi:hypothetical protein
MHIKMPQPAWLVYGPPGCGKTTWILNQVKQERKKLFHWNARTDRTLREGRENLHRQVRSQDPLFVWIEGADDLTPEAQAFLRRILETASQSVQCVLECRDPQRITPAIQSRCKWVCVHSSSSFRKELQTKKVKLPSSEKASSCSAAFQNAENPIDLVKEYLVHPTLWSDALLYLKSIGSGNSAWPFLFSLQTRKAILESGSAVQSHPKEH